MNQNTPTIDGLEMMRQIIVRPEIQRIEEIMAAEQTRTAARFQDMEQRMAERMDTIAARLHTDHTELIRRTTDQSERLTQMMEQVTAQFGRRLEALLNDTKQRLDGMQASLAEQEKAKLDAADFGAALTTLGQRFAVSRTPALSAMAMAMTAVAATAPAAPAISGHGEGNGHGNGNGARRSAVLLGGIPLRAS